jgi:hypothetical protein
LFQNSHPDPNVLLAGEVHKKLKVDHGLILILIIHLMRRARMISNTHFSRTPFALSEFGQLIASTFGKAISAHVWWQNGVKLVHN